MNFAGPSFRAHTWESTEYFFPFFSTEDTSHLQRLS
jgi:hypothetical protein